MEERKSFFASLEPKSALIVGLVAGFLSLCTIGFFVLVFMVLKGGGVSSGQLTYNANQPVDQGTPQNTTDTGPAPAVNVPKTDKPKVELFVMSHCPYGLQMQKAYIPAWELLKNKADIDVKFVSYIMHGQVEKDDNNIEYCLQKEQNDKYIPFLKCFTGSGDSKGCLNSVGANQGKLDNCINAADKQFAINAEFNNQAHWLSGQFPIYNVNKDLNEKYQVQGSPTLVINGSIVEAARSPEGVKQAICASFKNPPKECQQTLSNSQSSPGFGTQVGGNVPANNAGCAGA
jgi:hypothetical protein